MKKVIRLTESDLTRIVKRVIKEQSEETNYIKGIQRFLNKKLKLNLQVDGKTGPGSETEKAISKYQTMIEVFPADGVWGPQTMKKMPSNDRQELERMIGGIFDRFLNWLGFD